MGKDKKDAVMRGTQTQANTDRAKKREDHSAQQLTEDKQQEHARHDADTLEISIGNTTDGEIIRGNTEPDTKKPSSASHDEYMKADGNTQDRNGSSNK